MNIKIQGGGVGKYANTNSSSGIFSYLQHEDNERLAQREAIEQFFNQDREVLPGEAVEHLDNNKAKLCQKDAKFFVITVSPSAEELKSMGLTEKEQALELKNYVNSQIMPIYASNFGKDINSSDLVYYAKIHHKRGQKEGNNMHVHIVVSRKDASNRIKLSPMTTHKKSAGVVKNGFDRSNFYQKCEEVFDEKYKYCRDVRQSFSYCNGVKKGGVNEIKKQCQKAVKFERASKTLGRVGINHFLNLSPELKLLKSVVNFSNFVKRGLER